jgi:hypothetical protein
MRVTSNSKSFCGPQLVFAAFLFIAITFGFLRPIVGGVENLSPKLALVFLGGYLFPAVGWLVAPLILAGVDMVWMGLTTESPWQGFILWSLLGYLTVGAFGRVIFRFRGGLIFLLGTGGLSSLVFYLVTNTGAWWTLPDYAKNFGGWLQALTLGIPGYPPTWAFGLRSFVGDLIFIAVCAPLLRPNLKGGKPGWPTRLEGWFVKTRPLAFDKLRKRLSS